MLILHHTCLSPLPEDRKRARTLQSAAARELLLELARALHLPHTTIAKTAMGRPFFKDLPTVDFSLSHAGELAICALYVREDGKPPRVGIDAEPLTHYTDSKITAFSARFFGKYEQEYLGHANDRAAAFTEIFVQKEAFAKYCGDGLGTHLRGSDTMAPTFEQAKGVRFYTSRKSNYFISLCLPNDCNEQPIPFSQFKANQ